MKNPTLKKDFREDEEAFKKANYRITFRALSIPEKELENKSVFKRDNRNLQRIDKVHDSFSEDEDETVFNKDILSNFIIKPDSNYKFLWDFFVDLIIAFLIFYIPINVCYGYESTNIFSGAFFDSLFIIDLLINFFVAFHNEEEQLIMNHKLIILDYLTSWFLIDLISAVPTNTIINLLFAYKSSTYHKITNVSTNSISIILFSRYFKLFKLTSEKHNKNKVYADWLEKNFNFKSEKQRVLSFSLWFLIATHNLACLWIYFGKLSFPNWISNLNDNENFFDIYIASIYFNWTTIFTVGYGDILSTNSYERIYNIFLMSFGICIYSFAVTSLSNLIMSNDILTKKFMDNLEIINDLRDNNPKFSEELYKKLYKFVVYDYKSNKNLSFSLIRELPNKIKNHLLLEMYKGIIKNFSFFRSIKKFPNEDFNSRVLLSLRPIKLYRGEILYKENGRVDEVIFVNKGTLVGELGEAYYRSKLLELRKNDQFGLFCAISNKNCPLNIRVKSHTCEVFIIRKDDLLQIEQEYPDTFKEVCELSKKNYLRIISLKKTLSKEIENEILNSSDSTKEGRDKIIKRNKSRVKNKKNTEKKKIKEKISIVPTQKNDEEIDNKIKYSNLINQVEQNLFKKTLNIERNIPIIKIEEKTVKIQDEKEIKRRSVDYNCNKGIPLKEKLHLTNSNDLSLLGKKTFLGINYNDLHENSMSESGNKNSNNINKLANNTNKLIFTKSADLLNKEEKNDEECLYKISRCNSNRTNCKIELNDEKLDDKIVNLDDSKIKLEHKNESDNFCLKNEKNLSKERKKKFKPKKLSRTEKSIMLHSIVKLNSLLKILRLKNR